jgi:hypothetical protein
MPSFVRFVWYKKRSCRLRRALSSSVHSRNSEVAGGKRTASDAATASLRERQRVEPGPSQIDAPSDFEIIANLPVISFRATAG